MIQVLIFIVNIQAHNTMSPVINTLRTIVPSTVTERRVSPSSPNAIRISYIVTIITGSGLFMFSYNTQSFGVGSRLVVVTFLVITSCSSTFGQSGPYRARTGQPARCIFPVFPHF